MTRGESIANLIILALGATVAFHSHHALKLGILISPGAGFLPFLCGIAFLILGAVWRLQSVLARPARTAEASGEPLAKTGEAQTPRPGSWAKLFPAFLSTVAYAGLFERIGFFMSALLFMFVWQTVVERQPWPRAVVITIVCANAMYALFRLLLKVELPANPLLL